MTSPFPSDDHTDEPDSPSGTLEKTAVVSGTLKILLVDDDLVDREIARRALAASSLTLEISETDEISAALELLRTRKFDCAVFDYHLPDGDALHLLQAMHGEGITTPVVVLTGTGDEVVAVELMKAGAADYASKQRITPSSLERSIRHAVRIHRAERQAHKAELELKATEQRLRLVLENVTDFSIITVDPSGKILDWSLGAERLFGYMAAETVGMPSEILFTPEDRENGAPEDELHKAQVTGKAINERWQLRKSGERFWASGVTTSLRDDQGDLRGFVKIARDLTDAKLAEEALRRSNEELETARDAALQASRAKSSFLANVGHELLTPLNGIINYAEMVEEELRARKDNVLADDLTNVRNSGRQLQSLVMDVLELSRIESGTMTLDFEIVDAAELVGELVEGFAPIAQKNGNVLRGECAEKHCNTRVDRAKVRQVMAHLLSNAIKFTNNGEITIRCRSVAESETCHVVLEVTDTGLGIPGDQLTAVFERFRQGDSSDTRRFEGTGLGLAIAKLLVGLMGGEITVSSEPGVGSTFAVHLPSVSSTASDVQPD